MYQKRSRNFTSKIDGFNRRKPVWACRACGFMSLTKMSQCHTCVTKTVEYFPSSGEYRRWVDLRWLEKAKRIFDLAPHSTWELRVRKKLICTWESDFTYLDENGLFVVEDVKGEITRECALKHKLFTAIYGYPVTIIGS